VLSDKLTSDKHHSKTQYIKQFKEWKWRKNLKSDEWKVIGEHIRRRKDEQKDSEVLFCGNPLSSEKVKKETSRHCYSMMEALEQQCQNGMTVLFFNTVALLSC
jgi:hypothetical protein